VALGAPGVNILSTLPGIETAAMQSYGLTTNYGALNGTSMACPHVAGVMALVCAQYPTDSCSQIIQRVLGNTDPVSSLNGRTLTGGRLDLLNALTQPPQSPFWPSYQWRMNGTNIPGQTGSSCSFGPVTINDDGDLFDVVVSNQCDTVISTAAVLTVDTPCQITNQPTGVIQCVSNPATLWVSATGTHINYRWRKIDGGWDSPWVLENSGPGSGNLFIGSSTNNGDCTYNPLFPTDIDTNGVAFGINASGGHTMQVTRSMIEPLQPGDVFTVSMDNGYVDADGAAGFAVYSADNQKWFEFFCTNNVYYWTVENLPPQAASVAPFTSHGISFYFDMMFPGQLLIVIQDPSADTGIIFEDFLPDLANDPPNHIVLYNRNAGSGPTHDVYFNNFASYENYDLNDLIGYDNAAETAYTNGWHNGDNGGTGPIAGATNNQYIIPSCALADSGIYDVIMENSCSFLTSANIPLTVQPSPCVPIDALDHFAWGSIPSPRFINTPFSVIIRAQDMTNGLFTNFPGTTILGTTNGIAVSPPVSGNFTQGVWTGAVVVSQTASNLVLRANDGLGHFGLANPINVISLPQLGMLRSGNIALYIWPAGYSGFVLETSGNLSPASWAPVPYSPIQTGDQYLLPLDMPGTNGFYRLRFPGP
jgi:hypothetical protein